MLTGFLTSERVNAILGWGLTGIVALGAAESLLTHAPYWGGFSLSVAAVASLPALAIRNWMAMVPWPLLFVAAIAVMARVVGFYPEIAGYLAIAALALIIVVELDVFTPVDLSRRFAVVFGVLTTMALESLRIIAQFYLDLWLGTGFLSSQTELQKDIVTVTAVAFAMGGLFQLYFAKVEPAGTVDQSPNHGRAQ